MNQTKDEPGIQWSNIVQDLLILLLISGILTAVSIFIQKTFTISNPAQELVSIIQKGKLEKNGTDPVFEEALRTNLKDDSAFINTPDFSGRTPLMWACYTHYNNPELALENDGLRLYYVQKMLALPGIDVQATDREGWTALHWASWSGMPQTVLALLNAGARVNQTEGNEFTPLMLAAMRGNSRTVTELLKNGADPALKNAFGKVALELAVEDGEAYAKNNSWLFQKTYSALRAANFSRTRQELKTGDSEKETEQKEPTSGESPTSLPERTQEDQASATV